MMRVMGNPYIRRSERADLWKIYPPVKWTSESRKEYESMDCLRMKQIVFRVTLVDQRLIGLMFNEETQVMN